VRKLTFNKGRKMKKKIFLMLTAMIFSVNIYADWNGYDWNTGNYVDIQSGSNVGVGQDIEIYDWDSGSYSDVEVTSINSTGYGAEVEVYDYSSGEYRTLDMD
jgi:hypothetical protein